MEPYDPDEHYRMYKKHIHEAGEIANHIEFHIACQNCKRYYAFLFGTPNHIVNLIKERCVNCASKN